MELSKSTSWFYLADRLFLGDVFAQALENHLAKHTVIVGGYRNTQQP